MQSLEDDEKQDSFIIRHRIKLIAGVVVLAGIAAFLVSDRDTVAMRPAQPSMVRITNILPPPLPRPPEPRPKPENVPPTPREMVMQEPVASDEPVPSETPPAESTDAAPGPAGEAMGTNIQGDGSANAFGLAGSGGGGLLGGGGGGGGGVRGGSRWGWYAGQMQSQIERALRNHEKTRAAGLRINVRLWADRTGRITRAQLVGSTGDEDLDSVIKNEVLTGLSLKEPPPADMPQPIVMRITAVRAN